MYKLSPLFPESDKRLVGLGFGFGAKLRQTFRLLAFIVFMPTLAGCGAIWESIYPSEPENLPPYAFHIASESDAVGLLAWTDTQGRQTLYLQREPILTRTDVKAASPMVDPRGHYFVAIRLTDGGSRKLARVSSEHIGQSLALVTGSYLMGAALIDGPIDKGLFAMAVTSRTSAVALAKFLAPDRPFQ